MSKRVINPNQLQMLMKPSELRRTITGSVDHMDTKDPTADWEEKMTDPESGLKGRIIRDGGIHTPVILDHGQYGGGIQMGNGHHRVQAAKEIEEAGKEIYVPVLHTEGDFMGSGLGKTYPKVARPGY